MAANQLCDYEVLVLRECAGQPQPGLTWGAAMGAALGFLKGFKLVECVDGMYRATEEGRQRLKDYDGQ